MAYIKVTLRLTTKTHRVHLILAVKESNVLSAEHWKETNAYRSIPQKQSQLENYENNESDPSVLSLVKLESKSFGTYSENIIKELLGLGPRTSSQNDGTRLKAKAEIKASRYWNNTDDCKWQHLEPEHDYDIGIFALLDFQGWKVWAISKRNLMGPLRDNKVVTRQGKQGYWTTKSAILPYLTQIYNKNDLDDFIVSLG
jgi:hypothetical protein